MIALEETAMKVTGGWHCGQITYEPKVDPGDSQGVPLHGLSEADRHSFSRQHRQPAVDL